MADDRSMKLGIETDEASINKAKKRLAEIEAQQRDLHKAFLADAKGAAAFSKELAELDKEAKMLNKSLNELEQPRKLDVQADRFDKVSRDVSLAGDAESGLRTIGRALGAAGASGAERAIGTAAEIPALLEAVPRLKESMAGLPNAIDAAGEALGTSGAGFVGGLALAGAAIGAVTVVLGHMTQEGEKQARVLGAVLDVSREVEAAIAEGMTTEQIEARLAEIDSQMVTAEKNLARSQGAVVSAQDQFAQVFYNSNSAADGLSNSVLGLSTQMRDLQTEVTTDEATVASLQTEYNALTGFLENGAAAANDAAAAEKALAEARTASVLTDAAQAGELATLKARAADLTREQIDSEIEAIDIRKKGLEVELAALEASGDTSEDVAKKISALREQLGFLGEQSDTLRSVRRTAKSSESLKAAEESERQRTRTIEEQARKQEQAVSEAARSQDAYTKTVRDAKQGYKDAIADIGARLGDTLIDNNQKLQDRLSEQAIEFQQNELAEEATFQRDLAKIKRDAERSEKEAVRLRDFAAAADAREQAADALDDRRGDEAAANAQEITEFRQLAAALGREREIADREARTGAERAGRDAHIARERSIRDAQASYKDTLHMQNNFSQQFVGNFKTMFDSILAMQQQMSSAGSRSTATRFTSRSSAGIGVDEMQYMLSPR